MTADRDRLLGELLDEWAAPIARTAQEEGRWMRILLERAYDAGHAAERAAVCRFLREDYEREWDTPWREDVCGQLESGAHLPAPAPADTAKEGKP